VNGTRGVLAGAVIICAILMASATSYTVVNPGQWYDFNQVITPLRSVFMLSPTTGWAVGDNGTILYWNGAEWAIVQSPATKTLYSVFFPDVSNPNDGWVVGATDTLPSSVVSPTILHWDGVAWVRLDISNGISWATNQVGDLRGLFFLTPSDGWAVGAPGSSTNIVHWSGRWGAGGSWTTKATPDITATLYSVQVLSNTATPLGGYAVGGKAGPLGVVFSWDGATWSSYLGALPAANLNSISMISSTDAWAVGDAVGTNPVAIRLSGTTWGGPMSLSALGIRNLYSVVAIDANNAFAVGSLGAVGASDIIKFTAPSWTPVPSPATVDLLSVCRVSGSTPGSSDIWSVGNWGTILRNTAGTWRVLTSPVGAGDLRVPPPTPPNLNSVHFTAPSDGWAVGNNGTIIKYDGIGWSTYSTSPLVSNNLTSVYTISPSDGYAVGQHGTILRLTSGGWGVVAQCPGPACLQDVTLRSVFELPTGEVWVVGNATSSVATATILHWLPPGPWSQVPSNTPTGANLTSTFFLADGSEGWAVGTNSTTTTTRTIIDHWKNGVWTVVTYTPPFTGNLALDSVVIVNNNPSNVWATGTSSSGGAIALHYDGTIWSPSPINQLGLTGWATISFVPGSTNDAWIVGGPGSATGGQTLHWDGVTWADVPLVPRPFLFPRFTSIQMLSATDGWAVGYAGHIIRLGPQSFVTTTVTSTSISTTTVVTSTTLTSSTATSSTNSSSTNSTTTTTSIPPSPIPGFPTESILMGLAGGLIALTIIRRRRKL